MNILYICTHNRCRSILSEAITNQLAEGRLKAHSAGSQPAGAVHPLSLQYLAERGLDTTGLQSQSWDDFEALRPEVVITVCDSAAAEPCPVWFGEAAVVHWGLPDPSKLEGSEAQVREAFMQVMDTIEQRVRALLAQPLESMSRAARRAALQALVAEA